MDAKTLEDRANEMAEFILPKIDSDNKAHKIITINGQDTHYIETPSGVLLLLNKTYTGKDYERTVKELTNISESFNVIFYKDNKELGEKYFRNKISPTEKKLTSETRELEDDLEEDYNDNREMYRRMEMNRKKFVKQNSKKNIPNSLRNYSNITDRIILLTKPEEDRIFHTNRVTYYEPKSEDKEGKLTTYRFWDVVYDYNTTDAKKLADKKRAFFRPEEIAKDCKIWVECIEHKGILVPPFNLIKSSNDIVLNEYRGQTPRYAYLTDRNK